MKRKTKVWVGVNFIVIFALIIAVFPTMTPHIMGKNMNGMRDDFISLKTDIQEDMHDHSKYRCCLDKPCTYCIEKTPGHGEGASCDCMSDIVNGVHPCGECIGEILEGHGNKFLAKYFATAIAEKTGEKEAIQRIIEEKYNVLVEEQL